MPIAAPQYSPSSPPPKRNCNGCTRKGRLSASSSPSPPPHVASRFHALVTPRPMEGWGVKAATTATAPTATDPIALAASSLTRSAGIGRSVTIGFTVRLAVAVAMRVAAVAGTRESEDDSERTAISGVYVASERRRDEETDATVESDWVWVLIMT